MEGWRYYNHAAMPALAPHVEPDTTVIQSGEVWKAKGVMLARWTTDFDCGYETEWWYVIKDEPFDISALKSKRRYEINKGKKNFECKEIDPKCFIDDIYDIQVAAYALYPLKYRPTITKEALVSEINNWAWYKVYGAFNKENGTLSGYALLNRMDDYIYLAVLKVYPESEPHAINAAIVSYVLEEHEEFLKNGGYISDGARNIQHETHFQDYLEKYFGFRKAYCRLHIVYNPRIRILVKVLYPFRKVLKKLDGNSIVHRINGVLLMESIRRSEREK